MPHMDGQHGAPPTHRAAQRALLTTLSDQPSIVEDFFNAELTPDGKLKARARKITAAPAVITGKERSRMIKHLNKFIKLLKGARKKNRDLIVNTVKRSEKLKESVRRDAETLADCMLLSTTERSEKLKESVRRDAKTLADCMLLRKLEVLKQHSRIQMSLLRNENEIYRRTLRAIDEKLVFAEFTLKEFKGSRVVAFEAADQEFFTDPNDLLKQSKAELAPTRNDLRQWLVETRKIYEQVSRETLEEDQVPREHRIRRIIESTVKFYSEAKTPLYKPCRNQEQELEAVMFDIRHKEGQQLRRWLAAVQARDPETVSPGIIKTQTRKVAEGFQKDYNLPVEWTPFIHTLVCRSIYGRLRKLNVTPHGTTSTGEPVPHPEFDAKDKELHNQISWMRTLTLEQLGIEKCFQMSGELLLDDQSFQEEQRKAQEKLNAHDHEVNSSTQTLNTSAASHNRRDSYENMGLPTSRSARGNSGVGVAAFPSISNLASASSSATLRRLSIDSQMSTQTNQPLLDDADSRRFFASMRAIGKNGSSDANGGSGVASRNGSADPSAAVGGGADDGASDSFEDDDRGSVSNFSVFSEQTARSPASPTNQTSSAQLSSTPQNLRRASTHATSKNPDKKDDAPQQKAPALDRSASSPVGLEQNQARAGTVASAQAQDVLKELTSLSHKPPPPPPQPYRAAIDVLEALNELIVPSDMLQCLVHCSQVIYETAREYEEINHRKEVRKSILQRQREMLASGTMTPAAVDAVTAAALAAAWSQSDNQDSFGAIGADHFFPIFLYVAIQARLPGLHRSLYMLEKFSSRGELLSETGYYLSTLDSAVHHIMAATPHMYSDLSRKEHRRALMDALLDLEDDDSDITAYTTASLLPTPRGGGNSSSRKNRSRSNLTSPRDRKRNTLKRQSSSGGGGKDSDVAGSGRDSPRNGKSLRRQRRRSTASSRRGSREKSVPSLFVDSPTESERRSPQKTPSSGVTDPVPIPASSVASPRNRSTTHHALTLSRRTPTPTSEDPLSANSTSNSSSSPFMDTIPLASSPLGAALNPHTFSTSKTTPSKSKDSDTPAHRTHERRKSSNISSASDSPNPSRPSPKHHSSSPPSENPEQPALSDDDDDEDERGRSLSAIAAATKSSTSTQTSSPSSPTVVASTDDDASSSSPSGIATLLRQHRRRRSSPHHGVSSPASAPHRRSGSSSSRHRHHRRKRSSGASSRTAEAALTGGGGGGSGRATPPTPP